MVTDQPLALFDAEPSRHTLIEIGTTDHGDDYLVCACRARFTGTTASSEWDQYRQHESDHA